MYCKTPLKKNKTGTCVNTGLVVTTDPSYYTNTFKNSDYHSCGVFHFVRYFGNRVIWLCIRVLFFNLGAWKMGDRGGTVVKVLCYKSEGRWFYASWCHWHKIFPMALWPWGRLSTQQKWVPGTFPGGKKGWRIRLTILPPSCAVVMKSGNLNFL